jgi:hypothetical protein
MRLSVSEPPYRFPERFPGTYGLLETLPFTSKQDVGLSRALLKLRLERKQSCRILVEAPGFSPAGKTHQVRGFSPGVLNIGPEGPFFSFPNSPG